MKTCGPIDLEYEPENERSSDMDHNKEKTELELGHIKDEQEFYQPGPSERKDEWGNAVTHQDSKSFPGPRGLGTY